MIIHTDSVRFGSSLWDETLSWEEQEPPSSSVRPFLEALIPTKTVRRVEKTSPLPWQHVILVEEACESQFDTLARVVRREDSFKEDVLCLAGTGEQFHGFKNRAWAALPGNLHVSALVSPHRRIDHAGVAFTVLAVVSVLQTLDEMGKLPGPCGVKWVNDILFEGAKIGGVLANAMIQGDVVTHAVIGIGLNIEKTPVIPPTPFVPKAGSLHEFSLQSDRCPLRLVYQKLMMYLGTNYRSLLAGGYPRLLEFYRSRSIVMGRRIRLHRESVDERPDELTEGLVTAIGDDLQLSIDRLPSPVTTGRLELLSE